MTAETVSVLVQARDQLERNCKEASAHRIETVPKLMSDAGLALDDVILLMSGGTQDFEFGIRRAAHRAMGQLEVLSSYSKTFQFAQAYQALLDIAYA